MLCSDGVVEGWGDWELVQLFSDETLSFERKCEKLKQQCAGKSKDNNTAIIAEIEEADAFSYGSNDELLWTTFAEVEADYKQYLKDTGQAEEEALKQEMPEEPKPQEETKSQEKPKPEIDTPIVENPVEQARKEEHASFNAPRPLEKIEERPAPVYGLPSVMDHSRTPKKKLLFVLLVLIVIVAVVAFAFRKCSKKTNEKSGTKPQTEQPVNGKEQSNRQNTMQL